MKQRKIKNNRKFSLLPMLILGVILADLVWEIWLSNLPQAEVDKLFIFFGLILARDQFATTLKPNISWSTQKNSWRFLVKKCGRLYCSYSKYQLFIKTRR